MQTLTSVDRFVKLHECNTFLHFINWPFFAHSYTHVGRDNENLNNGLNGIRRNVITSSEPYAFKHAHYQVMQFYKFKYYFKFVKLLSN